MMNVQRQQRQFSRSLLRRVLGPWARRVVDIVGIPLLRILTRSAVGPGFKHALWIRVGRFVSLGTHHYTIRTEFLALLSGNTVDGLQRYIYFFGLWEPNLTAWITDQLRPGDTFIDVGANIGYYSLLASKLVGSTGSVVAIEASPSIFVALQEHIERNKATNVRAVNMAVADREGSINLYQAPVNDSGKTSVLHLDGFSLEGAVPAARLGTILSAHELETARVIKIDVEGAEWSVTVGLATVFERMRPDVEIVVAISPERLLEFGRTPGDVLQQFARAGFHAYALDNNYDALSYLPPHRLRRPVRMREPIREQVDVVFSRKDVAEL